MPPGFEDAFGPGGLGLLFCRPVTHREADPTGRTTPRASCFLTFGKCPVFGRALIWGNGPPKPRSSCLRIDCVGHTLVMEGGHDFAKLPGKIACVFSGAALGKSFLAGFLFSSRIDFLKAPIESAQAIPVPSQEQKK